MTKTRKPLTEVVDMNIGRVDLVDGPANGTRFIMAKAAAPSLVSDAQLREMIGIDKQAETPEGDTYLADGGVVVQPPQVEEPVVKGQRLSKRKENPMSKVTADTTPAAVPDVKAARKVIKAAAKAKVQKAKVQKARKIMKRAVLGEVNAILKGTLDSLGDAHAALLDALKNEADKVGPDGDPSEVMTTLQALATKVAALMGAHAASGGGADAAPDDAPEDGAEDGDDASETDGDAMAKKTNLRKARKAAKSAKLAKRTAKDQVKTAKALVRVRKIGARNSRPDQGLIDTADRTLGQLGATFHQKAEAGVTLEKSGADDPLIATILKTVGGQFPGEVLEAIRADQASIRTLVEKMAKTPMPGGPRVLMDRDGSVIAASEGQSGLNPDAVGLRKAAHHFPEGSVEREKLEKEAAKLTILDLMNAS